MCENIFQDSNLSETGQKYPHMAKISPGGIPVSSINYVHINIYIHIYIHFNCVLKYSLKVIIIFKIVQWNVSPLSLSLTCYMCIMYLEANIICCKVLCHCNLKK